MVSNVIHFRPTDPAEAVEFDAFLGMLPILRLTHPGQFVAVCGGEIIATGVYDSAVERCAKQLAGDRAYFCGWAEPPEGYVFTNGYVEVLTENP